MVRTRVGYSGGTQEHATYHDLGDHAEAIQVEYDPTLLTYEDLLAVFWGSHDAAHAPRSGQYRSIILCENDEQCRLAEASRARAEDAAGRRVSTVVQPAGAFIDAEDYHQKYRLRSDRQLMSEFAMMYPDPEEFVDSTAAARVNGILGGYGDGDRARAIVSELGLSEEGQRRVVRAATLLGRGLVQRLRRQRA